MAFLVLLFATLPVAVTFELLPERLTLVSLVLQGAGLGGLFMLALARLGSTGGRERGRAVELGNVIGAGLGAGAFLLGFILQELL